MLGDWFLSGLFVAGRRRYVSLVEVSASLKTQLY